MQTDKSNDNFFSNKIAFLGGVFGCIGRSTVRWFKNIPNRIVDLVKRKINEYKRKPAREDINKVYVLVGYTTKRHIDARYDAERFMIILRKGLLILIFVLILLISIKTVIPYVDIEQYRHMFGIGDVEELTQNDPFANTDRAAPVVYVSESTTDIFASESSSEVSETESPE